MFALPRVEDSGLGLGRQAGNIDPSRNREQGDHGLSVMLFTVVDVRMFQERQ